MSTTNIERAKKIRQKIKDLKNELHSIEHEVRKEQNKKYCIENKSKINKKIDCLCNGSYTYKNKSIHEKSKIHQKYIRKLKDSESTNSDSDTTSSDE